MLYWTVRSQQVTAKKIQGNWNKGTKVQSGFNTSQDNDEGSYEVCLR